MESTPAPLSDVPIVIVLFPPCPSMKTDPSTSKGVRSKIISNFDFVVPAGEDLV